jgi:hypothetical protein
MPKIEISAEPAAPPEAGVKVHVRKIEDDFEMHYRYFKEHGFDDEKAQAVASSFVRNKKVLEELSK